jgi:ADP-heptose:LPS heptosyltransferase
MTVLVHLASGVGNIVLATPLLVALDELGFTIDVCLNADYPETADLLRPWSVVRDVFTGRPPNHPAQYDTVVPAIPPFYWKRFAAVALVQSRRVERPPDRLFTEDEQSYYLEFARKLGYPRNRRPACRLPIGPRDEEDRVDLASVVIAPGCKTGQMAAKRWPHFPELAARFRDVAIVGTPDDLRRHDDTEMRFPAHAKSFIGALTLRDTAELMASAGVVVANDSGLAHVAAAVGTPTVMLFGPTAHACLGPLPPNASVARAGLGCEPCWTRAPLAACGGRVDCLARLSVDAIERRVRTLLGAHEAHEGYDGRKGGREDTAPKGPTIAW